MTLLEQAVALVSRLPPETQDNVARVVLQLVAEGGDDAVALTADEATAIARSKAAAAAGEFASEQAVQAVWTQSRPCSAARCA